MNFESENKENQVPQGGEMILPQNWVKVQLSSNTTVFHDTKNNLFSFAPVMSAQQFAEVLQSSGTKITLKYLESNIKMLEPQEPKVQQTSMSKAAKYFSEK